jgi:hypothetical protein
MTRKQSWINRAGISTMALWVLVGSTGCNPFAHYQHRHTGLDFLGERHITYYHYPNGSWFVPNQQKHHQPVLTEPQFHGFAATCWTRWPEPWQPCPPPGLCPTAPGVEYYEVPHEVIPTPAHGQQMPAMNPQLHAQARPQSQALAPPPKFVQAPTQPRGSALAAPAIEAPMQKVDAAPAEEPMPKLALRGKFGFSSPDDEAIPTSAVVLELPARTADEGSKRY